MLSGCISKASNKKMEGKVMIIKINGVRVDHQAADLMQPKRVIRKDLIKKTLPLGHKITFTLALATMAADMILGGGSVAMAASSLSGAFEPVKNLLLDIADPLCYVMFVWGCIECIVGRPASGLNRMKYAAIGFISINWIPVVMDAIRAASPN